MIQTIIMTLTMVLKTGPDRPVEPVQPGTGIDAGSLMAKNRPITKPVKTSGSTKNRIKPGWSNQNKPAH